MAQIVVTPPASEPVLLSEAKQWLRIDNSDVSFDSLVTALLTTARTIVETDTGRSLMPVTLQLLLDGFPPHEHGHEHGNLFNNWGRGYDRAIPHRRSRRDFRLLTASLVSVTSILYTDPNGTQQTVPTPLYVVDTSMEPGRISLAYGQSWPSTLNQPNVVQVNYVAGYADAAHVPQGMKDAIRCLISFLFDNPGASNVKDLPLAYNAMIMPFKTGQLY